MTERQKPLLKVSVISDYICPFCFIGHKRLQRLRQDYDLKINWCFVEIHPDTPTNGQPVNQLNYTPEHWDMLMRSLQQLAIDEGLKLADQHYISNSRLALLLAEETKTQGPDIFYLLHEKIFDAYFIQGLDIGDEQLLHQLAKECGIHQSLVDQAWSDPSSYGPADAVPQKLLPYLQYAGYLQARSVPTFVIGQELLTGAVSENNLRWAAERIQSEL